MGGLTGGKGSSSSPPPVAETPDYTAQMQEMVNLMGTLMSGTMSQMGSMMQQSMDQQSMMMTNMMSSMPTTPEVERDPVVDWEEEESQLARRAAADYSLDQARKMGAADTVLTSPLLDDEEANVTGSSVLSGE